MSSEGRGVGRVPRRGAGRGTRGRGRARARAIEDLGAGARAVENPRVDAEAVMNPRVEVRTAVDPRVDGILRALEEVGILMGRQTQERDAAIAQAAEVAVAAAINGNNENRGQGQMNVNRQMPHLVEQFLKLKPPKFDGGGELEAVSLWVEELEKAFDVLGCTDDEKVTLAVYQLQESASDWWKANRGRVFLTSIAQTWAMFVKTFNGKYFFSENAWE